MTSWGDQVGGDHYKDYEIQPSEFLQANKIPWLEACAIKYLCRFRSKDGRQDLEKARHYIDMILERDYGEAVEGVPNGKSLCPPSDDPHMRAGHERVRDYEKFSEGPSLDSIELGPNDTIRLKWPRSY
jgi:hypothetical protein